MGSSRGGRQSRQRARDRARSEAESSVRSMVTSEAGRLRSASPEMLLGLLAGSALAPVAATHGTAGLVAVVAGLSSGVGTNLLSTLVAEGIERVRKQTGEGAEGKVDADALAEVISHDVTAALARSDAAAAELGAQVYGAVQALGGFEAALSAASGELREHLRASLPRRRHDAAQGPSFVNAAGVQVGSNNVQINFHGSPVMGGQPALGSPVSTAIAVGRALVPDDGLGGADTWAGGADVVAGNRVYMLIDDRREPGLLAAGSMGSGDVIHRQAVARQTDPEPASGQRYAWLRQVSGSPGRDAAARPAREALNRERDLLVRLGKEFPRLIGLSHDTGRGSGANWTTLALSWPSAHGEPCPTLRAMYLPVPPGEPLDPSHLSLLLRGMGGLVLAVGKLHDLGASHRALAPAALVVVDDYHYRPRDLGLAASSPKRGEGADGFAGDDGLAYQAPEQALRGARGGPAGRVDPGPATDVYQVAAITYHLATGQRPAMGHPVPARALNDHLPASASDALDAALAADPASRPSTRELHAAFTRAPLSP